MYLPVVSTVSSVVVSGTGVVVVLLETGFKVVLGPTGCCVNFFVLEFAAVGGVVKLGFWVGALELMLWGALVWWFLLVKSFFELLDGELEMVVAWTSTVVLLIISVVDKCDGVFVSGMTGVVEELEADVGLFVDCFGVDVLPPTVAELGVLVPDDKVALTKAMLLMIVITENDRFTISDCLPYLWTTIEHTSYYLFVIICVKLCLSTLSKTIFSRVFVCSSS